MKRRIHTLDNGARAIYKITCCTRDKYTAQIKLTAPILLFGIPENKISGTAEVKTKSRRALERNMKKFDRKTAANILDGFAKALTKVHPE